MAKKKKGFGLKLKKRTVFSIISITLFCSALLVIFSFLNQGLVLVRINRLLIEAIGLASLFLPFLLISIGLMFSKFKTPLKEVNVPVGATLLFLSFLGLARTGAVGAWIWDKVEFLITPVGAFLIFLFGVLIGLVVLFNTSLDQLMVFIADVFVNLKKYLVAGKKKPPVFVGEKKRAEKEEKAALPVLPASKGSLLEQKTDAVEGIAITPASVAKRKVWKHPPLDLLEELAQTSADRGNVKENAGIIEKTLDSFGIIARVAEINTGPAVTQYALEVALGVKLSKITSLATDLALALAAPTGQIRIEAPIPGRSFVGIEVPNRTPEIVTLKTILASSEMKKTESKIAVPLGLKVSGDPLVTDLKKMPHVLIAGQTGSGKSVLINSWICNFLFRATPQEVGLILIDPKRVELTRFNGIPHLLTPVIHEPEKVVSALRWAIKEMDRRYEIFSEIGARDIDAYNGMAGFQSLPYILIFIDELADIMLFAPAEIEDNICRIAQMARATGIHLVLATQRPSVDVLTGLIKANIPCRISFAVSSMTDSRVILDTPGAEKLLGRGDMLFVPPDQAKPTRIQGPFISDEDVTRLVDFLKKQEEAAYNDKIVTQPVPVSGSNSVMVNGEERDEYFAEAARLVLEANKASASLIQRRLKVGYARAARILDQMEGAGIVGPPDGSKPREVLVRSLPEEISKS